MTYDFWQSFLTGAIEIVATYFFTLTLIAIVPYTFSQHAKRHTTVGFPDGSHSIARYSRLWEAILTDGIRESDQHWHRP
jgi:cbb3-type cytochrome oxidase subunit 3